MDRYKTVKSAQRGGAPAEGAGIVEAPNSIDRTGDTVTLRQKHKKTMGDLVEALRKIGSPPGAKFKRQKIVFPKRRGL